MPFDIASLDTLTLSERGVPMTVVNPKTAMPVLDTAGKPVVIMLKGRAADAFETTQEAIRQARGDRAARGIISSTAEIKEEDVRLLCALTMGWTIEQIDGQDFPFSPENARRLWSDPRWPWLKERAIQFAQGDGNFLMTSSPA